MDVGVKIVFLLTPSITGRLTVWFRGVSFVHAPGRLKKSGYVNHRLLHIRDHVNWKKVKEYDPPPPQASIYGKENGQNW